MRHIKRQLDKRERERERRRKCFIAAALTTLSSSDVSVLRKFERECTFLPRNFFFFFFSFFLVVMMMVVVVMLATTRTAEIVGVAVGVVVVRCPFFLSHFKDIIKITLTNKSTLLS